jgi:hypothetical protein
VLEDGATAMNEIFPSGDRPTKAAEEVEESLSPEEGDVA